MWVQAKIVRSSDRVDAKTKLARSKGFGFVEFSYHAHALAALRYLNCNPLVFPEKTQLAKKKKKSKAAEEGEEVIRGHLLMVEFAIENNVILKRRDERKEQDKKRKLRERDEPKFEKEEEKKPKVFLNKKRMKMKQNRSKQLLSS